MHYKSKWVETLFLSAGFFIAELSHAKRGSGEPWVRKWGNLPYTDRPTAQATVRPQEYRCKITQSTGMATQMQLEVILAGNHIATILGDPGAVSRVGRKGRTKVFKYGRKSPWVPTLTELFPKIQAHVASWLDAQYMLCIIVPNRRTVSPEFFSWVRTRRLWTRLLSLHTCPVCSPSMCVQGKLLFSTFLTRNEGTTDESKKRLGCYQQEQFNLPREYSVFDGSQCIINNRKFKMRRRRESQ